MKLEVTHKEIVAGLTQFLASQGITGFDPKTCQVTFSTKRGTGELSAVLDTDPAPAEEPTKPATTAETSKPKAETAPASSTQAAPEPEVQTEAPADETAAAAAGSDDDNLFD